MTTTIRKDYHSLGSSVKLQSDLSASAIKKKATRGLALWACLRSINQPGGDGILPLQVAIERLVLDFNFPRSTVYSQLLHAEGKFLSLVPSKRGTTIKIWGLSQLLQWFSIASLTSRHWRTVRVEDFDGYAKRTAQLYASILPPVGIKGTPLSRATITSLTGLHKVQQRRYEVLAGVRRTPNFAMARVEGPLGKTGYIPMKQEIFTRTGGLRDVNKRLGNSYHTRQQPGNKGMLTKVGVRNKPLVPQEAHHLVRSYFLTFRKLIKAITRRTSLDKAGFYLINSRKRIIKGRQEWCCVSS